MEHKIQHGEPDEDAYLDQNGRAIEPCTLEQIDRALGIIRANWPQDHPDTQETLHQFGMLREDMAENLECGTDINFNSVTREAMESYNTFLANYPGLVQNAGPTEWSNIAIHWKSEQGMNYITFMEGGTAYCTAGHMAPKDTVNGKVADSLSQECQPGEIDAVFQEMRNIQQNQAK